MDYIIFLQLIGVVIIFLIVCAILKIINNKIIVSESKFLNPSEYLPEEEIQTLKQVYYLIMMLLFFMFILYNIIYIKGDLTGIAILEIIVLAFISTKLDYTSWKHRIFFLLIIPYGSISYFLFNGSLIALLDIVHLIAYAYLMKAYFDKFREYTETNGLGIAIILLFSLIFISFIITIIVEDVGPLNSLVMVSNAFTSNGYAILGSSSLGKLNSLFLVWGGYILSGVGTATLTAAILIKHFNKRFDELEELIKNNEKE